MGNEQIKQNYRDIANAIRSKTGENGTMTAEEMPSKIEAIETGIEPTGTIELTTNGDHDVTEYAEAHVNVPQPSGWITINEPQVPQEYITDYAYLKVACYFFNWGGTTFWQNNTDTPIFGMNWNDTHFGTAEFHITPLRPEESTPTDFNVQGNIFGELKGIRFVSNGENIYLDFDSSWEWNEYIDDYGYKYFTVKMALIAPDLSSPNTTKDISTFGITLEADSPSGTITDEEKTAYLNENYPGAYVRFIDMLGQTIVEVPLHDIAVSGGGS